MSNEKLRAPKSKGPATAETPARTEMVETPPPSAPAPHRPPFFRQVDWLSMLITTLCVFTGYFLTLAPDLTLEDSGELAVGSFYAGVPHPPGYPMWTLFTWLFTVLVPHANIAWRVALASAVVGSVSCGLLALMVSRGGTMIIEGIAELRGLDLRWERAICFLSGFVSGVLLGYNGFLWSQCVIVEVYPFSVLSLMGALVCLMRWTYAPEQRRYLYLGSFLFGLCFTNHQTLIVAAMGIEVLILLVRPQYGRDLFCFNALVYILGLWAKQKGLMTSFDNNVPLFVIYNVIGIGSILIGGYFTIITRKKVEDWWSLLRDLLLCLAVVYVAGLFAMACGVAPRLKVSSNLYAIFHVLGLASFVGTGWVARKTDRHDLPRLRPWRRAFLGLSALYFLGLFLTASGAPERMYSQGFNRTPGGFLLFHGFGLVALGGLIWILIRTTNLASEIKLPIGLGAMWLLGAAFYFYMPVASMTNPPMNWGYARTVDGFAHALTRGQYERTNPTSDPVRFWEQIRMYFEGAVAEFNLAYMLIGVIPLVYYFFRRLQRSDKTALGWLTGLYVVGVLVLLIAWRHSVFQLTLSTWTGILECYLLVIIAAIPFLYFRGEARPERAWLAGLSAIFLCLGVLLLVLLNPNTDKQSRDLTKVFFTASYVMVAMWIGYGLTLVSAYLLVHYERFRFPALVGSAVFAGLALFSWAITLTENANPLMYYTAVYGFLLALVTVGILLLVRLRTPFPELLVVVALMPVYPILSHWWDNEQRGHLFGFWFGHDMFRPTITGQDAKPLYPDMTRDAILFGGTDPGRFCPTYMIFCESFIPPQKRRDPAFDRRDVYIITQNALADGTYLNYIRAHYNRSTQMDPPFFQELFRTKRDLENGTTNLLARAVIPLDRIFLGLGERIEARRRALGVYPPVEIHTPSVEESKRCFEDYVEDAKRRLAAGQLDPGEDVHIVGDRVQVSGQVSVMQINGLLTKVIFDANPTNDFFVEESFPLKWMYPHLTPFGIIMKINRQPLPELTEDVLQRDHEYWTRYSERLCGNWITYETPVKDICSFVERVYHHGDFRHYTGDRKFIRDNDAQKAFSKLRSAIGGVYAWRVDNAKTPAEQTRMFKEADFAFRQAFAFCPFSPEAVFRYVNLLAKLQRWEDALMIAETCFKFDPENRTVQDLVKQLLAIRQGQALAPATPASPLAQLEQQYQSNPASLPVAFNLASAYFQQQQSNAAFAILDRIIVQVEPQWRAQPSNAALAFQLASAFGQRQRHDRSTAVIDQLITNLEPIFRASPTNAHLGLDLVSAYLLRQKNAPALEVLNQITSLPEADASILLPAAQSYAQLQNVAKLEETLAKLVKVVPNNPEAWYDLAAIQAVQSRNAESLKSLTMAVQLSNQRLSNQPGAKDLRSVATQDGRFQALQPNPEYKKLVGGR